MTAVEPAIEPAIAVSAQGTALPEPLRPAARARTQYWDAADCCWHNGGGAAQVPAPRSGD